MEDTPRIDELRAFTRGQAAELLAISVRQLDRLLAMGEIRAVRVGRVRRIPASELRRILGEKPS